MIHIIHMTTEPGGTEVLIPKIIENMSNYNFLVFVVRPPKTYSNNTYNNKNVKIEYGSFNNLMAFIMLWGYAFRKRKDIFHVMSIGPFFLFALRLAGVKRIVYSFHGGAMLHKSRRYYLLKKFLWWINLSNKYVITVNSEYYASVFAEYITDRLPTLVLYNPIYGGRVNLSEDIKRKGQFTVIYVGRLVKGKNLPTWITVALALHKNFPYMNFKIYGDGPLSEKLRILIKEHNASDHIHLEGFRYDIQKAYNNSDLLLLLSEHETFGNVVVESILCGTPVIVSAIPSMREIFKNYPDFLIELDEQLEQNLIKKFEQIDRLKDLVPSAREEFRERFSLQQYIKKLEVIYDSL